MTHAGRAAHDRLVADRQNEQTRLVSQTEVVRASHAEAGQVVDAAHAEADRLRRECDDYVDTTLGELEATLNNALGVVGRGRSQLWRGQYGPGYDTGGRGYPQDGRTGTGMDLID